MTQFRAVKGPDFLKSAPLTFLTSPVANWLREGWFVPLSYVVGFFLMVMAKSVFTGGS
jgi:hypothetical protein